MRKVEERWCEKCKKKTPHLLDLCAICCGAKNLVEQSKKVSPDSP